MPRKGWSSIPVSDGWLQVLRGPRPPAAKWPRASKPQPTGHAKLGPVTSSSQSKVRSLEAALAALGPDDSTTKAEVEAALRRAKQGGVVTRVDPDTRVAAARERVARLERALAAMGDIEGPEVSILRTALKRAQKDAQVLPVEVQIRQREAFIERARKRIAKIDEDRLSEVRSLEEAERKLTELRALAQTPPPQDSSEVDQLRSMVSQLQAQVDSFRAVPVPDRQSRREDFVPHCDEEMQEWMESRQKDLQTAVMAGHLVEVSRISNLLTKAAAEWQQIIQEQGAAGNSDDKLALRGAPGEGRFAPYW